MQELDLKQRILAQCVASDAGDSTFVCAVLRVDSPTRQQLTNDQYWSIAHGWDSSRGTPTRLPEGMSLNQEYHDLGVRCFEATRTVR